MHDDLARILRADLADHRRVAPEFMRAHRREDILRVLRRDDREQLTLVGAVHRVKPQHIAGGLHLTAHRYCALAQLYSKLRALDELIERRCDAAARRVAQDAHRAAFKYRRAQAVERRAVGLDIPLRASMTAVP